MDSVMVDSVDRLGKAAMGAVMDRGLGGTDIVSGGVRHGTWDTETDKTQIKLGSTRSLRSAVQYIARVVLDI